MSLNYSYILIPIFLILNMVLIVTIIIIHPCCYGALLTWLRRTLQGSRYTCCCWWPAPATPSIILHPPTQSSILHLPSSILHLLFSILHPLSHLHYSFLQGALVGLDHRVVHRVRLGASPAGDGGGLAAVVLGGAEGRWWLETRCSSSGTYSVGRHAGATLSEKGRSWAI